MKWPLSLDVACPFESLPPSANNLATDTPVPSLVSFGDSVKYKCRDGFHFEEDFSKVDFEVKCLSSGSFEFAEWKSCIDPKSSDFFENTCWQFN